MTNWAVRTDPGQLSCEAGWGLGRSLLQRLLEACPIQDAEELAHLTSRISKGGQTLLFGPLYLCPTTCLACFFTCIYLEFPIYQLLAATLCPGVGAAGEGSSTQALYTCTCTAHTHVHTQSKRQIQVQTHTEINR